MALTFKVHPVKIEDATGRKSSHVVVPMGKKVNLVGVAIAGFTLDFAGRGDHHIDTVMVDTSNPKATGDTVEFDLVCHYSDRGAPEKEYNGIVKVLVIADVGP